MEIRNKKHPLTERPIGDLARKYRPMVNDKLPPFDFQFDLVLNSHNEKKIKKWLAQVDSLKKRFSWSDSVTKHKVLVKLEKMNELYAQLGGISKDMTWKDWKKMFVQMFPRETDYGNKMRRMLNRKKKPDETYKAYYTAKLELIREANVPDGEVVSCLIGGVKNIAVASIARVTQSQTPEDLLEYFKWCKNKNLSAIKPTKNDKPKAEGPAANKTSVESNIAKQKKSSKKKKRSRSRRYTPWCINCGKVGHVYEGCPTKASTSSGHPAIQGEREINTRCRKWNYHTPNAVEVVGNAISSGGWRQELVDERNFKRDMMFDRPQENSCKTICLICFQVGHETRNCVTYCYTGPPFRN